MQPWQSSWPSGWTTRPGTGVRSIVRNINIQGSDLHLDPPTTIFWNILGSRRFRVPAFQARLVLPVRDVQERDVVQERDAQVRDVQVRDAQVREKEVGVRSWGGITPQIVDGFDENTMTICGPPVA